MPGSEDSLGNPKLVRKEPVDACYAEESRALLASHDRRRNLGPRCQHPLESDQRYPLALVNVFPDQLAAQAAGNLLRGQIVVQAKVFLVQFGTFGAQGK